MAKNHREIGDFIVHSPQKLGTRYYCRVRHKTSGDIKKVATRETHRRRAEQYIIRWAQENSGQPTEQSPKHSDLEELTFSEAFEKWLSLRSWTPKVIRDYRYAFTGVYLEPFGDLPVAQIRPSDVERLVKSLQEKKRSPRTQQFHLATLRRFFRWAAEEGYRSGNPAEPVTTPPVPKRTPNVLSVEEARRLLRLSRSPDRFWTKPADRKGFYVIRERPTHLFYAILLGLYTGLRRGNILALKWDHIDFDSQTISIPAEEMKARADHQVPLHPALHRELLTLNSARRRSDSSRHVLHPPQTHDQPIETGAIEERIHDFKKSWSRLREQASISAQRFHDATRKTFASWLAASQPYAVVQALLGHRLPDVTGRYVNISLDAKRAAIESLPNLLTEGDSAISEGDSSELDASPT